MLEISDTTLYFFILLLLFLGGVSFITTQFLLPMVIRRSHLWGILDMPGERKAHSTPTPRLGGLSIAPSLWLGCACALLVGTKLIALPEASLYSDAIVGLLLGCSGMFLLGVFDDLKQLNAQQKLLVQSLVACVALPFLPAPELMTQASALPNFTSLFILLWLVILPNSVNLLDGVDGLTATLVSIFLVIISFMAFFAGEYSWLFITVPSTAALAGFLRFNWAPAKVFLGDSGSLLLGFVVAYLSVYFSFTQTSPSGELVMNPLIAILLTLPWIVDTGFAITRRYFQNTPPFRVFARRSKAKYFALHGAAVTKIWRPDRGHIHHQLQRLGFQSSQVVGLLGVFSFIGMLAAAVIVISEPLKAFLSDRDIAVSTAVFVGLGLIVFWKLFRSVHLRYKQALERERHPEKWAA